MKIVHLVLCGSFGEQYAYQDNLLPKYHRREGHDVTIVAPTYSTIRSTDGELEEDPAGKKLLPDGTVLIRLKPALPKKINKRLHIFKGLYRVLREEKPELLFVHGLDSLSYRAVIRYQKKNPGVKVVVDNHTDQHNGFHSRFARLWLRHVNNPLVTKPLLGFVRVFYGVTPARCRFLQTAFGVPDSRIKLLPFGADDDALDMAHKSALRAKVREQYHIQADDFLVVTGGRIDRRKNIHLLASAVAQIDNPKVKLLVFGAINEDVKAAFEAIHSDKIIYTGWVPSDAVYQYFYAGDLVFFPGLHSVLWEQAVASKVPCAFTKLDGFEHVNFNGNSVLLDTISVQSCRELIQSLYTDRDRYAQMKEKAEAEDAGKFTYSRIAKQVLEDIQ